MKRFMLLPLVMICALPVCAHGQPYTDVTVEQAHALWVGGIFLLDVRTPDEFNAERIAGAVNIWVEELESRLGELAGYEHVDILVYCGVGGRSARASGILADHGFDHVYNMLGGIQAWADAGYPTVGGGGGYHVIGLDEARSMWQAGVFVLDARSPFGYVVGHIPGAVNIPVYEIVNRIGELAGRENDPILVYCTDISCSSSARAAAILVAHGFTQVYIFRGGFAAWKDAGYEIERESPLFLCSPTSAVSKDISEGKSDAGVIGLVGFVLLYLGRRYRNTH